MVAYCSSHFCTKDIKGYSSKGSIKPNIPSGVKNCPDCGYALMWVKKGSNTRASVNRGKKTLYKDHKRSFMGE